MGLAVNFNTVRAVALSLPGVEEGTCYRTPAFRVRGKSLLRLREDGESLAVKIGMDERDLLIQADPHVFFIRSLVAGREASRPESASGRGVRRLRPETCRERRVPCLGWRCGRMSRPSAFPRRGKFPP